MVTAGTRAPSTAAVQTAAIKIEIMMHTAISRGTVVGLFALSIACGRATPIAPTPLSRGAVVPSSPAPPPTIVSGPSRTFTFDHQLAYGVRDYTKQSRFILYDNGAFALEYVSLGLEYRGTYTDSNGVVTFQWEGWSVAGPWGATGRLKDDSLTVQFNDIMQLSDFEDAIYRLPQ